MYLFRNIPIPLKSPESEILRKKTKYPAHNKHISSVVLIGKIELKIEKRGKVGVYEKALVCPLISYTN